MQVLKKMDHIPYIEIEHNNQTTVELSREESRYLQDQFGQHFPNINILKITCNGEWIYETV